MCLIERNQKAVYTVCNCPVASGLVPKAPRCQSYLLMEYYYPEDFFCKRSALKLACRECIKNKELKSLTQVRVQTSKKDQATQLTQIVTCASETC